MPAPAVSRGRFFITALQADLFADDHELRGISRSIRRHLYAEHVPVDIELYPYPLKTARKPPRGIEVSVVFCYTK
jgi:hypothetical protein